jgi:hypothetical protein
MLGGTAMVMLPPDHMGVTGNAILVLGFIAGAIHSRGEDAFYELVEVDAAKGTHVLRHCTNGNTYLVSVVQLDGTE